MAISPTQGPTHTLPTQRTDRRSSLEQELGSLSPEGRDQARDAGRQLVAQLAPGMGYFHNNGRISVLPAFGANGREITQHRIDGVTYRSTGQVMLPR